MRKEYAKMSEKNTNDKKNGAMKKKRYNPEQKCEDLIRNIREQCAPLSSVRNERNDVPYDRSFEQT